MERTFTPLLTYNDLQNYTGDIIADVFGIDEALSEMLPDMKDFADNPDEEVLAGLFKKISHSAKVH